MYEDNNLQKAVLAALKWEPSVNSAHIGVAASSGVITLTGHVEHFAEKQVAEATASRVWGVKAVIEQINIGIPLEAERKDDEIAKAVVDCLAGNVSVLRDSVKVRVEKGWITLTGEVDSYYHKNAIEQEVRRLHSVVGVSNQVMVKPGVVVSNITENIRSALHRSWFVDPNTVTINSDGGKVQLTGTANSVHDRQLAATIAWAAGGVTDVENNLEIV